MTTIKIGLNISCCESYKLGTHHPQKTQILIVYSQMNVEIEELLYPVIWDNNYFLH
jgi:hypothetical protein